MEKRKIYPYLIEEGRMAGYYEILLDEGYNLKKFERKENKKIYDWYLPEIKDYLFWTFYLTDDRIKNEEFDKMSNDLKSVVCDKYQCNIFKNEERLVICFKTGICFAITDDKNTTKKLKKYEEKGLMRTINLREDEIYSIPKEIIDDKNNIENNPELYAFILQLYKMIYLNKIQKDIQNASLFDKTRNKFVDFTEKLFNVNITDKQKGIELCNKWQKKFKLDDTYLKIDNEFDLLYKNNKLNYNKNLTRFCILLFTIAIIIGIINLWNMM